VFRAVLEVFPVAKAILYYRINPFTYFFYHLGNWNGYFLGEKMD